jgi:hypothetical protein
MSVRATLLIGSPKRTKSTSDALGTYLLERLKENGACVNKIYIQQMLSSEQGINTLCGSVGESDLLILASPLYADSHHSGVIAAMELIHKNLKDNPHNRKQMMVAISNSGFPEASQNDLSLAISRRFALECGFEWAGGLALGGGESIGGRRLEEVGGLARNVRKSLDLAAEALVKGGKVPEVAVELMAKPLMPKWFYLLAGNIGWLRRAKKQGCRERLNKRPYRER